MKLRIEKLTSPVTFDIADEKAKVSDDSKGHLEVKAGSKQIMWMHFESGVIAYDPEAVTVDSGAPSGGR